MAPRVSVVIPARNAAGTLGEQLAALAEQSFAGEWEVVVVDDNSTDGTADVARSFAHRLPSLRVVPGGPRTVGGASAPRNTGVRAARGDRVLCCDADDVVRPGWISAMAAALETSDVVGGVLRPLHGPLPAWQDQRSAGQGAWPGAQVRRGRLPTLHGHLPYAISANVGFRREVFDALGGFDESLPTSEDVDFSWRAQQSGYSLAHVPEAEVGYRSREGLRAIFLQGYRYGRGAARVRVLHERSGSLPPESRAAATRRVLGEVKALARVDRLFDAEERAGYVKAAGWLIGSLRGVPER